jgi:hypothetical protein
MTDGTVWIYDGAEGWRYRTSVPQEAPDKEKPSAIIG